MDVLTDVLESIHVRSLITGRLELTAPWGLSIASGRPGFLVVTRGTCWLDVEGLPQSIQLAGGDFVLLPKAPAHVLRDSPASRALPLDEVLCGSASRRGCRPGGIFQHGGGGAMTTLVGGCFRIDAADHNPLLSALPPIVHVKGDHGSPVQWLEMTLQFVASEMAQGQPGTETVVSRLADVLFVQAVRAHLADGAERSGWLRALVDPQIGQALGAIHEQPANAWTVESLASSVGMSRSAFAARFSELVGEPPLTYLTRWRMAKAARLLRDGTANVSEIADRVGYEAEAAFSKAFKRWIGTAPGAYRRQGLAGAEPARRAALQ